MWRVLGWCLRQCWRLPWWLKAAALVCAPLAALNLAVSFIGDSVVFPLSPYRVPEKWEALKAFVRHVPQCALRGHEDAAALAEEAERRHGLPRGLMAALVGVESEGRPHRISWAGAMGAAQLVPGTAALLGVVDPFDPRQSIDAGARYLKQQLQRTRDVALAVAAYNAGPGAVHGRVPVNGETEHYVRRVLARFGRDR